MTPNDIQVGKKYTHPAYFGCVWLGTGKRTPFTSGLNNEDYFNKELVLIFNPEHPEIIGGMFKTPEDEYGAEQETWDNFILIG